MATNIKIRTRRKRNTSNKFFLVILVLLGFFISIYFSKNILLKFYFESKLTSIFASQVDIEEISTDNFLHEITLKKVEFTDPVNPASNLFTADEISIQHSLSSAFGDYWMINHLNIAGVKKDEKRKSIGEVLYPTSLANQSTKVSNKNLTLLFSQLENHDLKGLDEKPNVQDTKQFSDIKNIFEKTKTWEYNFEKFSGIVRSTNPEELNNDTKKSFLTTLSTLRNSKKNLENSINSLKLEFNSSLKNSALIDLTLLDKNEINRIFWQDTVHNFSKAKLLPLMYFFGEFNQSFIEAPRFKIANVTISSDDYSVETNLNNLQSTYDKIIPHGSIQLKISQNNKPLYHLEYSNFKGLGSFELSKVFISKTLPKQLEQNLLEQEKYKIGLISDSQKSILKNKILTLNIASPRYSTSGFQPWIESIVKTSLSSAGPVTATVELTKLSPSMEYENLSSNIGDYLFDNIRNFIQLKNNQNNQKLSKSLKQSLADIKKTLLDNIDNFEKKHLEKLAKWLPVIATYKEEKATLVSKKTSPRIKKPSRKPRRKADIKRNTRKKAIKKKPTTKEELKRAAIERLKKQTH